MRDRSSLDPDREEEPCDALEIVDQWSWSCDLPPAEAARLVARGLHAPIDGETATALLEKLNRMALDLALVRMMLEGEVVARANVDPSRKGRWIYSLSRHAAEVQDSLPPHDDVSREEWGR